MCCPWRNRASGIPPFQLRHRLHFVGDIRVNGELAGVELVQEKETKEIFPDRYAVANLINKVGRDNDVFLSCSPWCGDIIILMNQLNMPDSALDLVFHTIDKAVEAVKRQFAK